MTEAHQDILSRRVHMFVATNSSGIVLNARLHTNEIVQHITPSSRLARGICETTPYVGALPVPELRGMLRNGVSQAE
jgi:hypothetical protein